MDRKLSASLVVVAALVAAEGASAQATNPIEGFFGAIFGQPPRPPSEVPRRPPPQDYTVRQDQRYDPRYDQRDPRQGNWGPPPGVRTEPLAPPPGAAAVPPQQRSLTGLPPGQRQPRGTPQPANTAPQPGDEVIAPPPSQKIVNQTALFAGLDKITGRIIKFDVAIDETVQFGALRVTPRSCYTRPPSETPNTDGFLEVDEITLQGEVRRIFTGWMYASSPGLHAVEHPIYDIWLTDCKSPTGGTVASTEVAPPAPAAAPAAPPPARPAQQRQPRQAQPAIR